jgi:hypothetical protein
MMQKVIKTTEPAVKNGNGDYLIRKKVVGERALYQVCDANYNTQDTFFIAAVDVNEGGEQLVGGADWESRGKYIKGANAANEAFKNATNSSNQYYENRY